MEKNYTWGTTFNTAENLMIHTFTDRVKVVSNIKTGVVKVLKDGEVINTTENPVIVEYEKFLLKVADDANKLAAFKSE
jgi:hypothetical protein